MWKSKKVLQAMHLILPWEFFLVIKETIALTKNPIFHGKNKHIDIKFHYFHDLVKDRNYA